MRGAVAAFNPQTFALRYPEFGNVSEELVALYFEEATLYLANDGTGPVANPGQQLMFLNMITAHICQLNAPPVPDQKAETGGPQLVGGIVSAGEGSVSVGVKNDYPPGSVQWFQQTKYGSNFWAATKRYRTMHYRAPPNRLTDPFNPFGPRR